jgi:hypothetical protein
VSDTVAVRHPARQPEGARAAPHAPPATAGAEPAASAWAVGSVSAPFGLALPVQRKPVIGRAGDAYEREADAVADRVVSRGTAEAPLAISRVTPAALAPPVQRMSPGDRTEHDDPPRPGTGDPGIIQRAEEEPKPGDDTAAVQTKPADSAVVQRAKDETKPGDDTTAVQPKGASGGVAGGSPAMRDAAATAIATRGPGAPLPPRTRGALEAGMGVSLRDVRVHTGPAADQATGALHARAFTHGRDIWVGRGESPSDTRLMAHEATHVLQQDGVVRRKPEDEPEPPPPPEPDDEERKRPRPGEQPRPHAASAVAVAEEPEAGPTAPPRPAASAYPAPSPPRVRLPGVPVVPPKSEPATAPSPPAAHETAAAEDGAPSTPSARAPLPVVAPPLAPPLAAPKTPTPAAATPPAAPSAPPPPSGPAAPRAATTGTGTTGDAKSAVSPASSVTAPTAAPTTKPGATPTAPGAEAAAPAQADETAPAAEGAPLPADSAAATEGAVPTDATQPESATAEATPADAEAAAEGAAAPEAEGAAGKAKEEAAGEPKEGAAEPKAEGAAKPAAGAAGEAAAEAAAPPGPEADPNFQAAIHRLQGTAARERAHKPAAEAADDAQAAARPPDNDRLSRAGAAQVDSMSGAQVAKPPTASFLELLRAKIAQLAPKNLSELDDFKSSGKAAGMKADLTAGVARAKSSATGDMKARTEAEPQPSSVEPKPVTPLAPPVPGPTPGSVGAARAVPPPQPAEAVSLDASSQSVDRQMAENDVDDPQLQEANDPRFSAVATARDEVKAHAAEAPAQYREEEAGIRGGAARANARDERGALGGMHAGKKRSQKSVSAEQEAARAADEAKRREVANHVELLFNQTRAAVEGKLSSLDTDVNARFDAGEARARQQMEDHVEQRKDDYKDRRYSGIRGKYRWVRDKFRGLPAETKVFYEEGRDLFIGEMDKVIVDISNLVEARLQEAKDEVVRGKASIATYVEGLEGSLKKVGKDAQAKVGERFQELEQAIEDKKDDLASGLAQRYNDARQHADERLAEMRKADRGLVAAFVEKLGEIIEILRNFKQRLMAMLAEAADAIGSIVKHPIRFLGNLVSAVKQGVQRFSDNIVEHLKEGLFGWLFGALAAAGITLPSDFSLQSIFGLVLQVLGITPETLRRKLGKLIGERNVGLLEKAWGFVQRLVSGGIGGLWEEAKEYLSDLQETLFASVQEWVVTRVVKAAILKLVSMFNPAGAIIAAIQGIISTVQFFFERINQILDLVQAIVSSVGRIARGDVDGAAAWIETSMARAIPLMISFLAGLLGLGGVAEKVRSIIQKLQHKVDAVIDRVIGKIVGVAKSLFGGKEKAPAVAKPGAGAAPGGEQAAAAADAEAGEVHADLTMQGAGHVLSVPPGPDAEVQLASDHAGRLSVKIDSTIKGLKKQKPKPEQQITDLEALRKQVKAIERRVRLSRQPGQQQGTDIDSTRYPIPDQVAQLSQGLERYSATYGVNDIDVLGQNALRAHAAYAWIVDRGMETDFVARIVNHPERFPVSLITTIFDQIVRFHGDPVFEGKVRRAVSTNRWWSGNEPFFFEIAGLRSIADVRHQEVAVGDNNIDVLTGAGRLIDHKLEVRADHNAYGVAVLNQRLLDQVAAMRGAVGTAIFGITVTGWEIQHARPLSPLAREAVRNAGLAAHFVQSAEGGMF